MIEKTLVMSPKNGSLQKCSLFLVLIDVFFKKRNKFYMLHIFQFNEKIYFSFSFKILSIDHVLLLWLLLLLLLLLFVKRKRFEIWSPFLLWLRSRTEKRNGFVVDIQKKKRLQREGFASVGLYVPTSFSAYSLFTYWERKCVWEIGIERNREREIQRYREREGDRERESVR